MTWIAGGEAERQDELLVSADEKNIPGDSLHLWGRKGRRDQEELAVCCIIGGTRKAQKAERGCERGYHGCCNNVDAQGLEMCAVNRSSIVPEERVSCG